ncbi:hypothetical protein AB0280_15595 [Pseudarthrobacter sp902506025]|uniref:hypothetical protein n=1 Tax=Pseudarthrobacter sp. 902506025 TaxID=3155291 RepID=UPI00344B505A
MMTVDQLVKAFQQMRQGQGITVEKLQHRPELLAHFNIATGAEFISFLEEATVPVMNHPKCKAALVALAIGHDRLKDLRERRRKLAGVPIDYKGDFEQNCRRVENEGFIEIATLLLDIGRKRIDSRDLYARMDALEAAVRNLSKIALELIGLAPVHEEYTKRVTEAIKEFGQNLRVPPPGDMPLYGDEFDFILPAIRFPKPSERQGGIDRVELIGTALTLQTGINALLVAGGSFDTEDRVKARKVNNDIARLGELLQPMRTPVQEDGQKVPLIGDSIQIREPGITPSSESQRGQD